MHTRIHCPLTHLSSHFAHLRASWLNLETTSHQHHTMVYACLHYFNSSPLPRHTSPLSFPEQLSFPFSSKLFSFLVANCNHTRAAPCRPTAVITARVSQPFCSTQSSPSTKTWLSGWSPRLFAGWQISCTPTRKDVRLTPSALLFLHTHTPTISTPKVRRALFLSSARVHTVKQCGCLDYAGFRNRHCHHYNSQRKPTIVV